MSSRALRRLRGKQRGQEALDLGDLTPDGEQSEEEQLEVAHVSDFPADKRDRGRKAKKNKAQKNVSNIYELICDVENEAEKTSSYEDAKKLNSNITSHIEHNDNEESDKPGEMEEETSTAKSVSEDRVKKKKKKKKKKGTPDEGQKDGANDNIDLILENLEQPNGGLGLQNEDCGCSQRRHVLNVEHRNLNSETELKKYFGARAVLGDQRPRQRNRQFHRSTWLTSHKDSWPRFSRTGISMTLLQTKDGVHYFTFEHDRDYQQVQFKFFDAVESMDPNNIVALLQANPYHIDSLLQLSDVCRIQEDQEMARDLIERALYSLESTFHPLFSLTSGNSRLDYLRPENRAFYLALYKHMMFLEKRGCPRTALEFCKLILSLDPDSDPLCMLLLIDFLMLRSREYQSLLHLYQDWEDHRNLSQLPNFAFSTALCHFHLSQEEDLDPEESDKLRSRADEMLENALIMFPGVLMPLLDLCTVQPDATVTSHAFFGPKSCIGQPPALTELTALYIGRSFSMWREAPVMLWLEECVKEVLRRVDANDPQVEDCQNKRQQRYQSAPRNIHRHVLLSEIKEATSCLPLEVTTQPMMGFDPLPPLDSVISYTQPERQNGGASNESTLSLFFRSLLPNFNFQGGQRDEENLEVAQAGQELNQEVNRLMVAMRDMLANIRFQEPPRDDNPYRDEDEWD
ncbi:ribosome quality control complex subunit TCF25 isoform X1 [Cynoglossus semilaevis]|uniref:ribosome quality control complex subunit TCF25 isoform X1 n=1 Tax=Cynoglossus semilaevis TaxID=244447 RepID=UPI000D628F32|nr:transcription factor 25 isoform X1 [Cynoglossus semilaevis]